MRTLDIARYSSNLFKAVLLIGLLAWNRPAVQAAEGGKTFTKGPYLQAPGQTTMTVMWESTVNGEATVHYGLEAKLDQAVQGKAARTVTAGGTEFYLYKVTINGLKPDTTYSYVVEQHGAKSNPKHFRTFDEHPAKVRFVAYGDTRSNPDIHADIAKWFKSYEPDFILHTGDLVARGKQYDLWEKEFFTPLANVIDEIPLLAAIGNHEDDGTNYLAQFHMADNELWYSFDAGPVHFLALDFRSEGKDEPQYAFAEKDLMASKAPWKIVFLHIPMFNFGGHNSTWGHEAYLPLLHKARVDLVVGGHSHFYERFKPLTSADDKGNWAITHITTGGGAPLYNTTDNPSHAAYFRTNHFVVLEASADTIKGQAVSREGKVFDEFTIKKINGQYDKAFLDTAFDEVAVTQAIKKAPPGAGGGKGGKKGKKKQE